MLHPLLALAFALPLQTTEPRAPSLGASPDVSGGVDLARGELHDLLVPIVAEYDVPGMGCALIVEGELLGLGAAGLRAAGSNEPVTISDRWHLGSCTKAMTATLVARLVEAEQLTWETRLSAGFEGAALHPDLADVTLVQLLSHTAGLMPNPTVGTLWKQLWESELSPRAGRELVVREVLPLAPEVEPGTRMLYSNTGYAVLGALLERDAELAWEQLMVEQVFEPLGMSSAGFGAPGAETPDEIREPRGHGADGKPLVPGPAADNPAAMGPAGTAHATLADWARFVQLHLGVGPEGYLTEASLVKLQTPPAALETDYALGWGTARRPWSENPILRHSGSNTLWYCTVWLVPEEGLALLVTVNSGGDAGAQAADAACVALLKQAGRL